MTQRDSDRRAEDVRLAAAVTELQKTVEAHSHPDLEANIEELATALLGPPKSKLAGNGRRDEEGLIWRINEGGLKLTLPWWTKVAGFALIVVNIGVGLSSLAGLQQ